MTENNINAYCKICGQGYHICNSCKNQKQFKPWKSIVDTIEHYKIYSVIHNYTISKNKESAKEDLQNCNLTGFETFNPEIKSVINEIMEEPVKTKKSSRKRENISK